MVINPPSIVVKIIQIKEFSSYSFKFFTCKALKKSFILILQFINLIFNVLPHLLL